MRTNTKDNASATQTDAKSNTAGSTKGGRTTTAGNASAAHASAKTDANKRSLHAHANNNSKGKASAKGGRTTTAGNASATHADTVTNTQLTQEYFDILNALGGDIAGRKQAYAYMKQSSAIVHNRVVDCTFIPRLFNTASWEALRQVAETTHTILCKVMTRYLEDPAYREVFSFDKRLEDLILIPRRYEALLPFARIDVFLDEDTFACGFCEFNADGSAGLNENREITLSIMPSATYQQFAQRHSVEPQELFASWVDEFIAIYQTFENRVDAPNFAICDYLECGVVDEFRVFARYFEERGYPCYVCDVRSLRFEDGVLRDNEGHRIDAIWRRSVTNDVLANWDASQDLIEAVHAGAVALIGSFAGHLVHDKQIFEALRHPKTQAFLTQEENAFIDAHVPKTLFLDSEQVDLDEIIAQKDRWIIKPTDQYGAKDVYAGAECSESEWAALVERYANEASGAPFIVQSYITPYQTVTLPPDKRLDAGADGCEAVAEGGWGGGQDAGTSEAAGESEATSLDSSQKIRGVLYNNLSGLYLYNGTFKGVFSRMGPHPTISKENEGMTAASIRVLD